MDQCDGTLPFDDIVLAVGTGGTAGGVALGVKLAGLPVKVRIGTGPGCWSQGVGGRG